MKKQELLKMMDESLLEKLFGFCYARTNDSYEAQELCSDILYALVRAASTEGDIKEAYPFIWRVARNVYADYTEKRRKYSDRMYGGNAEEIFELLVCEEDDFEEEELREELLAAVYRRIAFLTKAYREVMIMFYLDNLSVTEIAKRQNIGETAVRQRLFAARKKIKSEVEEMSEGKNKPAYLDKVEFVIWGTGSPKGNDPRTVCSRQFSKHIVWLCHKKPMTASEIAEQLNVPTVYVEEELAILAAGENGKYGLVRKLENGRYGINFVLFDKETTQKVHELYSQQLPNICNVIERFIEEHKEEYLAFPYINKKPDLNLILWQQVFTMSDAFQRNVERILEEKFFADVEKSKRPFSVFGYEDNGKYYGGGWDGIGAKNLCGYSEIHMDNIYITRIREHFHCGADIGNDFKIQLAIRAINGLNVDGLSETEKEHAAKAIECGYLYREGDMLYTKILVNDVKDNARVFDISRKLQEGYFEKEAEEVAAQIAGLIRKAVPDYMLPDWKYANNLANLPVLDGLVEVLIEKGILTPPEDGIGAEGCWMGVKK